MGLRHPVSVYLYVCIDLCICGYLFMYICVSMYVCVPTTASLKDAHLFMYI